MAFYVRDKTIYAAVRQLACMEGKGLTKTIREVVVLRDAAR